MKAVVLALLLLVPTPLVAQRAVPVSGWVTEIGAGAGADLLARGPWMAPAKNPKRFQRRATHEAQTR
jgi:hypothetical protein